MIIGRSEIVAFKGKASLGYSLFGVEYERYKNQFYRRVEIRLKFWMYVFAVVEWRYTK